MSKEGLEKKLGGFHNKFYKLTTYIKIMAEKPIQIKIPYKLAGRLSKKIKETGFDTITEYVVYVLEQTLSEDSENGENNEEEEKNVRQRLKELGYL